MSFEYPFPPISYEDDGRIMVDIHQQFVAKVTNASNKAIIEAIREWAKEKGGVTFIEIPEEKLMEILMAGVMILNKKDYMKCLLKEMREIGDVPDTYCPLCGAELRSDFCE